MRWKKSDIWKIFLCLMMISVMLGICNQLSVTKYGTPIRVFAGEGLAMIQTGIFRDWDNANEEVKMIALTFDDGPNALYTERLLDGLAERDVKATFFLIGRNVEAHPEIVSRIAEEGHLIGNHTYSHMQLTSGKEDEFLEELSRTSELIEGITGETPMFCRPPYGIWNASFEAKMGIIPVLWDVDPKDWCTFNARTVASRILKNCHDGAIILLHDEYASSVDAALMVIDELKNQGYTFVTVDQLLIDP